VIRVAGWLLLALVVVLGAVALVGKLLGGDE
jgi:hypothetical protein